MSKVRFGIIGAGGIAPFHIYSINEAGGEVVAIADPAIERAKKLGAENDIEAFADYKKMAALKNIDVVTLCIPSGLHMQAAVDCMELGKHVISEKPLEVTLEKIDRMLAVSKTTGRHLSCILQSRFFDNAARIKEAVEAGKFGKLTLGDCYNKWFRSEEYYKGAGWRATWELDGGGALMNQAVHAVDLLLYLMGDVESVSGYCETLLHPIQVEDTAAAVVKFRNGALGVIEGTTSVYPGEQRKVEIHGNKGTAILEGYDTLKKFEFAGEGDRSAEFNKEEAHGGASDPLAMKKGTHSRQFKAWIEAFTAGKVPPVPAVEARKSVELILAIYRSAKERKEIKLPL